MNLAEIVGVREEVDQCLADAVELRIVIRGKSVGTGRVGIVNFCFQSLKNNLVVLPNILLFLYTERISHACIGYRLSRNFHIIDQEIGIIVRDGIYIAKHKQSANGQQPIVGYAGFSRKVGVGQ